MYSSTNRQVLSADGETLLRLVSINGVDCWQASTGRTFPQVAGAEDPPPAPKTEDPPKSKEGDADDGDDFDKDRALATIKKLRDQEKASKAQLRELETLKAKQKERDDAEKSEADRLKEQIAELERKATVAEQQLTETRNRQAIERAAIKAGAAEADDVFQLLKSKDFELDDGGNITNADKLVTDLLKAKPYLVGKQTNGVPGTPRSNGQATRDAGVKEAEEKLIATRQYQPFG